MVLTKDPKIVQLRQEMRDALRHAEMTVDVYRTACEPGPECEWASFLVAEIRQLRRQALEDF